GSRYGHSIAKIGSRNGISCLSRASETRRCHFRPTTNRTQVYNWSCPAGLFAVIHIYQLSSRYSTSKQQAASFLIFHFLFFSLLKTAHRFLGSSVRSLVL